MDREVRHLYPINGTCATQDDTSVYRVLQGGKQDAVLAMQARVIGSWIPFNHTDDFLSRLDPGYGLLCRNQQQVDGQCEDYEVRYCCLGDILTKKKGTIYLHS